MGSVNTQGNIYRIRDKTRRMVMEAMEDRPPMSAKEIGMELGLSARTMCIHLSRLYDDGSVTYVNRNSKNSAKRPVITRFWSAVSEAAIAPLYGSSFVSDARALAECLGGYTFPANNRG